MEDESMVRCQVFVRGEMYPATYAEPWPPDWWNVEVDGDPDEGNYHAYHLPVDLAERAFAAVRELREVGKLIGAHMNAPDSDGHSHMDDQATGTRLPCGCPNMDDWDWLVPCPGHVWTHWHTHDIYALAELRFCFYCGVMETQTLAP